MSLDDYYFDETAADRACEFIERLLKHWKGRKWAGRAFMLEPWERIIVRDVFGWKRKSDGTRKYRFMYVEVPKKNGKTMLAAAIALLLLFADGEPGAEVYSAAADRRQAEIVYMDAKNMTLNSKPLRKRSRVLTRRILNKQNAGWYEVCSSDVPTKHGLNPHGIVFDELHTQPNRDLYDTLRLGIIARTQPLIVMITTAGEYDEESVCWTEHEYAEAVIKHRKDPSDPEGIDDPDYYAVIYAADPEDDWTDLETWRKANPNFGVTITESTAVAIIRQATRKPVEQPTVKQLHLNIWQHTVDGDIQMDAWNRCNRKPRFVDGAECYGGLDIAAKLDLNAAAFIFPDEDAGYIDVLMRFWVPGAELDERKRKDVFDYPKHVAQGNIHTTPGYRVDQRAIRKYVNEIAERYELVELGFDPWNASQMATWLEEDDGLDIVEMRQGAKTLSEPSKALVGLALDGMLRHGGHPVLAWNARNTRFARDSMDGWRPVKDKKGRRRVDGIVALIMALGRWIAHTDGGGGMISVIGGGGAE
ncbi:MAG: terminase large subunit [Planctomycetes bacterium]|nr:terminase large subunit [Planctomycetota bacterium]